MVSAIRIELINLHMSKSYTLKHNYFDITKNIIFLRMIYLIHIMTHKGLTITLLNVSMFKQGPQKLCYAKVRGNPSKNMKENKKINFCCEYVSE